MKVVRQALARIRSFSHRERPHLCVVGKVLDFSQIDWGEVPLGLKGILRHAEELWRPFWHCVIYVAMGLAPGLLDRIPSVLVSPGHRARWR